MSPLSRRRLRLRLAVNRLADSCFLAVWSLEAEGFLREERAREDAAEGGVRESSAIPDRVLIPNKKNAATARMASLLLKVMIETSLV